jgi:type IV secretion system protein VirB9
MDGIMKINALLFCLPVLLFSCRTVDVRKAVRPATGPGRQEAAPAAGENELSSEPAAPGVVFIEKPIYIPQGAPQAQAPQGRAAVEAANRAVVEPGDYANSAMLYDYHRDLVYELYCRPLRVSDITLQAGERTSEIPFISDSDRWMIGAGVSYENGVPVQHIYVKPTASGLSATLIINTSVRVYHLILRSFADIHMPIVRWRYPEPPMPQNYIRPPAASSGTPAADGAYDESLNYIDPRFLSFNYAIRHGFFSKPPWLPHLVYDDGSKTYVTFPELSLQAEMPAVFENRADVVNYRVMRNVLVIDKLIEKITVKIGNKTVTIEKKKGG